MDSEFSFVGSWSSMARNTDARVELSAKPCCWSTQISSKPPLAYRQKTETLDFCLVLEGSITLVLDTEEVQLAAGDVVVQLGTRHTWSNRSQRACIVAVSSHDARA